MRNDGCSASVSIFKRFGSYEDIFATALGDTSPPDMRDKRYDDFTSASIRAVRRGSKSPSLSPVIVLKASSAPTPLTSPTSQARGNALSLRKTTVSLVRCTSFHLSVDKISFILSAFSG